MKHIFLFVILFFTFQQNVWSDDLFNEFLVAKSHMPDSRFKETVIVMLSHNQEGAVGLVVNKPIETLSISKLFTGNNLHPPEKILKKEITLYWGGPVEPQNIYFIHSSDYTSKDFIFSNQNFTITRSPDILFDIAVNEGPKNYLILTGIAVWQPGQLDFEIVQGDWYKKLNSYIPLFNNGNEMWSRLIRSQDI